MDNIEPLILHKLTEGDDATYNEQEKDFIIKVEDETIPVHKDFLCTVSEYFRAMVESGMTESENGILTVKETRPLVVQNIVKYLYGERVSIQWDDVKDYLDFIELWHIPELKSHLAAYIEINVSASTCIEWYNFANIYNLTEVTRKINAFLKFHYVEASKSDNFIALQYEELVDVIENKEVLSPSAALEACISWTMSEASRKQKFENLLTHVEITKCNPARLKYLLKLGLVTSSSVVKGVEDIVASSIVMISNKSFYDHALKVVALNTQNGQSEDVTSSFVTLPFYNQNYIKFHFKMGARIFLTRIPCHAEGKIECMLWDPVSLEVTQLPSISGYAGMFEVQAASVDNTIYVMFHSRIKWITVIVYLDTESSEQWEEMPQLHEDLLPEYSGKLCSNGKFIFIFTGRKLHCYDTHNNAWTEKNGPEEKPDYKELAFACIVPARGCLYIIARGKVSTGLPDFCLCYRIEDDLWIEQASPPKESKFRDAIFLEQRGEIMDFNGSDTECESKIHVYNIAQNIWREIPNQVPLDLKRNDFLFTV